MKPEKVDGLRVCVAATPFQDQFGTTLDFDGPWSRAMLEDHSSSEADFELHAGLWVWEGSCQFDYDVGDDSYVGHVFEGKYRALSYFEMQRLAVGCYPLRCTPFPQFGTEPLPE